MSRWNGQNAELARKHVDITVHRGNAPLWPCFATSHNDHCLVPSMDLTLLMG